MPAHTGFLTEGQAVLLLIAAAIGVLFLIVWALS